MDHLLFLGNETVQEVSQTCLKSLCYLSVCITPKSSIDFVLEMIWKVSQSSSWKAKMSILEFAQTFVFTNFMSLCLHEKYVAKVEALVIEMMSDVTLQVRQKATKILCGLFHSQFIDNEGQQRLLKVSIFFIQCLVKNWTFWQFLKRNVGTLSRDEKP